LALFGRFAPPVGIDLVLKAGFSFLDSEFVQAVAQQDQAHQPKEFRKRDFHSYKIISCDEFSLNAFINRSTVTSSVSVLRPGRIDMPAAIEIGARKKS